MLLLVRMPVTTRFMAKLENESRKTSMNPCALPNFLKIMKENAGKDELYNLRQLSTQYRKVLSSTYFDLAEKCAVIEVNPNEEPRNYLSKVSKDFSHIYRHLQIKNLDFLDPEAEAQGQEVMEFLRLVGPNIKEVDIAHKGTTTRYLLLLLQEFLSSFKNMRSLKLNYSDMSNDIIGIRNVLAQFPLETRIEIHRGCFITGEELIQMMEKLSCLKNLTFHGTTLLLGMNFEQLFRTTNKWFNESKSSFKLVWLFEDETTIPTNINLNNMKHWLDRVLGLSKCTKFTWSRTLVDHYDWDLSSIPNDSCWKQNIKELNLIMYSEPLLCLRDFPNLEKLNLTRINVDRCLLSNATISDEDNLRAVFQGLSNLEVKFSTTADFSSHQSRWEPFLRHLVRRNLWIEL